ncbi:lipopolysaccharide biosynthesis protein [Arthrobacter humicola]
MLAFGAIQLFTLADFGLGTGIVRTLTKIHPQELGHVDRRKFVTVAGSMFLALALLLTLACVIFFPLYLSHISMSNEVEKLVPLVVSVASFSLFLSVMGRFANSTLWAEDRPDIERKASLAGLLFRALCLLFGLWAGYDLAYVILVEAVSIVIPSVICTLAVIRRYGRPFFSRKAFSHHTSPLIRISSALFVGTFTSVAASQVPLYIVGGSLGLEATTAFGALIRVFQSAKLVVSWLTNPFTHTIASAENAAKVARNAAKKCFLLAFAAALLISIPLIVLPNQVLDAWMGKGFIFAGPSLALIAVAVLSNALILPSALMTTLKSNPWPTSILGIVVLVLTLAGVSIGADNGSIYWATLGLVAPLALTAPVYVLLAHRVLRFRIHGIAVLRVALMFGSAALLALITFVLSEFLAPAPTVLMYALLAAFTGALGLLLMRRFQSG